MWTLLKTYLKAKNNIFSFQKQTFNTLFDLGVHGKVVACYSDDCQGPWASHFK